MQDTIYHMTPKSHFSSKFVLKRHDLVNRKRGILYRRQPIMLSVICIFNPLVDYHFWCVVLLHSQA